MQRFAIFLTILLFVSITTGQPPTIPLTVTGTVRINGEFAPVGTLVTAEMDGETEDYELTEPGRYVLSINGTIGDYWKEVKFYVDGILMDQTAQWKAGGTVNIDFSISENSTTTSTTLPSDESTTTSTSTTTSSSTTVSSTSSTTSSTSTSTITVRETTSTTMEPSTSTVAEPETTVVETTIPQEEGKGNEPRLLIAGIMVAILIILLGILVLLIKGK